MQTIRRFGECEGSADYVGFGRKFAQADSGGRRGRGGDEEKGAGVPNELVKKGELTIEQGKVLNEELKHNIKDAIRENVTIVTPPDDVISAVDSLSDEQLEALKAHIAAREATKKTAASAASDEPNEN